MKSVLRICWIAMAVSLWLPGQLQAAPATHGEQNGLPIIALAELATEAHVTLHAIKQGGPFAYERDGAVFRNFERRLPKRARGYYHEYTVKTPGARGRGAQRIISGEVNEYYYTADHYQTFKRIRE
ncbi:MAG TPA: ribonuclease domain-containing protein [Gallionella sp.]|nr:ribonuclease domain-containing protein [Gallionella sp.]